MTCSESRSPGLSPRLRSVFWLVPLALSMVLPASVMSQDAILGGKVSRRAKTEVEATARIKVLKKQLAANPKNYRFHFEVGNLYADMGRLDNAREAYEEAIDLNPKYVEALVNLGSLFIDLNQLGEAITRFEQALGFNPDDCKARSNLGNAYYGLQRYPDAMFEYMRAVEINPKCYSAIYNIAVAFADAGIFREAATWWEKVERVAPGTQAARDARENINLISAFITPPPSGGVKKDK